MTGAATITISGISGKDKILVLIDEASSANAAAEIGVRVNGVTTSSYYSWGQLLAPQATYTANAFSYMSGGITYIPIGRVSGSATSSISGYSLLTGCNSSGVKAHTSAGGANAGGNSDQRSFVVGGYFNSSSVVTSVSVFSNSGNLDAGTVYVYTSA